MIITEEIACSPNSPKSPFPLLYPVGFSLFPCFRMAQVTSGVQFCVECGSLLQPDVPSCGRCLCVNVLRPVSTTVSMELPGSKHWVVSHTKVQRVTVKERCPECGNKTMYFYTRQMRSADEGETVFYECPKCAFKTSANN